MLFFPVVMNALQYYIIDNFIKGQKPTDHEQIPNDEGEEDAADEWRRSDSEDSGSESGDDISEASEVKDKEPQKRLDEYDPVTDGEGSGGSSRGEPQNKSAPPTTEGMKEV